MYVYVEGLRGRHSLIMMKCLYKKTSVNMQANVEMCYSFTGVGDGGAHLENHQVRTASALAGLRGGGFR